MMSRVEDHELPNAGAGPDMYSLSDAFEDSDRVVLLIQRDYYCHTCREQTEAIAERYDEFRERDAEVVVVLPEPPGRARDWDDDMDLPLPLLADEEATFGDEYGQPVRFGLLGRMHDLIGRMPVAVVLERTEEGIETVYEHKGSSYFDRPSVDELLDEVGR